MDQSMMQKLIGMLRGGQPAPNQAYQQYAIQAQQNGQTPVTPQQFAMGQVQQPIQAPAQTEAPAQPFRF